MRNNVKFNGAFVISRNIFESDVWVNKPAFWAKLWIYILGNVNHHDSPTCERGTGFFNFSGKDSKICREEAPDKVKKFLKYAKSSTMISTKKSTRGIYITVLNYNYYQSLSNYTSTTNSTTPSTIEAPQKHHRSTTIDKNDKNDKNERMKELKREATPRSLEQVITYFKELGSNDKDANTYYNHFESNGWRVGGKTPMKDWRASARNWVGRSKDFFKGKLTVLETPTRNNSNSFPKFNGERHSAPPPKEFLDLKNKIGKA